MANVNYATGRRKEAIARVYMKKGKASFTVNGKNVDEFFSTVLTQMAAKEALVQVDALDKFQVKVFVTGGGITGQSEAICLGVARVLASLNEDDKKVLKEKKLLTRDSRAVERKHYGRKKARKGFQSSKR